jgi:hypothetical protein
LIKGRVIRIISRKRLVLNVGSEHGVEDWMQFEIYTPKEQIVDPETGEALGPYRRRKAVVEVDEIYEKFSVASRPQIFSTPALPTFRQSEWPDLPVSDTEIKPLPGGGTIVVGDIAEQVIEVEEDGEEQGASSPGAEG